MYGLIIKSDINSLRTLNSTFPSVFQARLTIYSDGDEQGWRKNYDLPKRLGLLHYGKQIYKHPLFRFSPINFALEFIFSFDVNQSNISFVLSLRKIYDESKNPKIVLW